jgi:hypothetical protein
MTAGEAVGEWDGQLRFRAVTPRRGEVDDDE